MKPIRFLLCASITLAAPLLLQAQPELTLEDLFVKYTFSSKGLAQPSWTSTTTSSGWMGTRPSPGLAKKTAGVICTGSVGTGNDNVHYQSFEMLMNELVRQNKMFSMMAYPMRTHGISERENTTYHLYQTMFHFWLEHLPAGGRL